MNNNQKCEVCGFGVGVITRANGFIWVLCDWCYWVASGQNIEQL